MFQQQSGENKSSAREKLEIEERRVSRLYYYEAGYYQTELRKVAGVDEAGRGPLAGPVVAAAVVLPPFLFLKKLNDSKVLAPRERQRLVVEIKTRAITWGVGMAGVHEIDRFNIRQATILAMTRALRRLTIKPDCLLIDGMDSIPGFGCRQLSIVRGDSLSASIAAASIVAKVTRDQLMAAYDRRYPAYGFARHKGYPTDGHRQAISEYGLSPIHRQTFNWQKK